MNELGYVRALMLPEIGRSRIGESATLFFALFSGFSIAGLYLGLLTMVLAAATDPGFWRWCSRQPLFWIAIAWSAYVLLRMHLPTDYPVNASEAADSRDGLISISGFYGLVLAWWLIDNPYTLRRLLILMPTGIMLGVVLQTEPEMWHRLLYDDHRFFAHMTNGAAGLYSGTILIGCILLGLPRVLERRADTRGWRLQALSLGLLAVAAGFLFVTSQSRSSWLAALAVLVLSIPFVWQRLSIQEILGRVRSHPWLAATAGLAVLALIASSSVVFVDRLTAESGNWRAVFTLDWDSLEKNSIGIRIAIYRVGLSVIADAPWLGAGIGTGEAAFDASGDPLLLAGNQHFHNLYIEILTMTGVIGLGFFLAVAGLVLHQAVTGLASQEVRIRRLSRFVLAASALFAVTSLFQVRYDDPRGLVLIVILTALALVCGQQSATTARKTNPDG